MNNYYSTSSPFNQLPYQTFLTSLDVVTFNFKNCWIDWSNVEFMRWLETWGKKLLHNIFETAMMSLPEAHINWFGSSETAYFMQRAVYRELHKALIGIISYWAVHLKSHHPSARIKVNFFAYGGQVPLEWIKIKNETGNLQWSTQQRFCICTN